MTLVARLLAVTVFSYFCTGVVCPVAYADGISSIPGASGLKFRFDAPIGQSSSFSQATTPIAWTPPTLSGLVNPSPSPSTPAPSPSASPSPEPSASPSAEPSSSPTTAPSVTPSPSPSTAPPVFTQVLQIANADDDGEIDLGAWYPQGETSNYHILKIGSWAYCTTSCPSSPTWGYFRFQIQKDLPVGTNFTGASLSIYGHGGDGYPEQLPAPGGHLIIHADITYNVSPPVVNGFTDSPTSGRRKISTTVTNWPSSGNITWEWNQWNQSPDMSALMTELVNLAGGLRAGDYVQFWIEGSETGQAEVGAWDYTDGAANAAKLSISWE